MGRRTNPETIRTFVAVSLPQSVTASIQDIQQSLKAKKFKVRWVSAANLHLTLKFLGPTSTDKIQTIDLALKDAVVGIPPMTLCARSLGVFPGIRKPRVIWVGTDGDIDVLSRLHRSIESHLAPIGFPSEKRSFKAHLTIGRVKRAVNPQLMMDVIQQFQDFRSMPFNVRHIELIKSDLKPQGPEYSQLRQFSLGD